MNITPTGNRVIIELLPQETSLGCILIPEGAQERPTGGIIRATGPGKRTESGDYLDHGLRAGQRVLFSKYAGTAVKTDDVHHGYIIVDADDILAVFN